MTEAVDDPTRHDPTEATPEEPVDAPPQGATPEPSADPDRTPGEIDVAAIEADLDGVQAALTRLADGTYWTDEVSGEPIPAAVLQANPLARRA